MEERTDLYDVALGVLAGTSAALGALLEPLPPELWTWSPAAGEWSPQDVLEHLLHVETAVIPVRVRHMIEEDGAPFASTTAAAAPAEAVGASDHPIHTKAQMLMVWRASREANLAFLHALTPAQLAHSGEHPRYGCISAREHIIEWAYHDLEHLRQIQATIEARLYPAIGGFRALYMPPYPQGEPLQGEPLQGEPLQGEPLQGEPLQGEPLQGEPLQGEPRA